MCRHARAHDTRLGCWPWPLHNAERLQLHAAAAARRGRAMPRIWTWTACSRQRSSAASCPPPRLSLLKPVGCRSLAGLDPWATHLHACHSTQHAQHARMDSRRGEYYIAWLQLPATAHKRCSRCSPVASEYVPASVRKSYIVSCKAGALCPGQRQQQWSARCSCPAHAPQPTPQEEQASCAMRAAPCHWQNYACISDEVIMERWQGRVQLDGTDACVHALTCMERSMRALTRGP